MLKQENNYIELLNKLKKRQKELEIEYSENIESFKLEKKSEQEIFFQYEKAEVKEEIELLEHYIKKMEYKEKVEVEYENLIRDSKK